MRLAKPLCRGGVLPMVETSAASLQAARRSDKLIQVSYHHDFANWKLAYSGPCSSVPIGRKISQARIARDFTSPEPLLLHTCDTGGASSGSPLLRVEPGRKFSVVAINVGTYIQTRMLVEDGKVIRRYKSDAIANTAVTVNAFDVILKSFAAANILSAPSKIRTIQLTLKARGFYHGRIDGAFGPATRQAIQAYRGVPGLELAGLPTRELLAKLSRKSSPSEATPAIKQAAPANRRQTLSRGRLRRKISPRRRR